MHHILARILAAVAAGFVTPWVLFHQWRICHRGRRLTEYELCIAEKIGVSEPESISVMSVVRVPNPLRVSFQLLEKCGVPCVATVDGITLGYGIYVSRIVECSAGSLELIAHELAHVAQYEQAGSICNFLLEYIYQCLTSGYEAAEWEMEARRESARVMF